MLDPFPLRSPSLYSAFTRNYATRFNLETLHIHVHEILLAAALYHIICSRISPLISSLLLPRRYKNFTPRTRLNWDVHVTSLVQSTVINSLALYVIKYDQERQEMDWRERIWGYTGACGLVQALAAGYFLWDLFISLIHVDVFGWGLVAHAISALTAYCLGFRPFVNYYAPGFILFELSTPFLNFHWFFDKLDMTGSAPQAINGAVLTIVFFCSRLLWGTYLSVQVFSDIYKALDYQHTSAGRAWLQGRKAVADSFRTWNAEQLPAAEMWRWGKYNAVPSWIAWAYLSSNVTLMILNVYWFGKMIETIRKRFPPPFGTKAMVDKQQIIMGRGIQEDGIKTVEVDSTEVRQRKPRRKV